MDKIDIDTKEQEYILPTEKSSKIYVLEENHLECWLETELKPEEFEYAVQNILGELEDKEYLQVVNLALGFNPEGRKYSLEEIKESLGFTKRDIRKVKSLRNDGLRLLRYSLWEGELDKQTFFDINNYRLLNVDISNKSKKSSKYKSNHYVNNFVWDIDTLKNIPLTKDINRDNLINFLNPKKLISYEDAENLLSSNPNILVASMSILATNYQRVLDEIDEKVSEPLKTDEVHCNLASFVFTDEEEVIFLTGRTLLKEFNKVFDDDYVKELIRKIDGIILRFNFGLVSTISQRYIKSAEYNDLFQEGLIGLERGLDRFDIDLNYKASTYLTHSIRSEMRTFVAENQPVRLSVYMSDAVHRFDKAKNTLLKELEREPTYDEVIKYCKSNDISLPASGDAFKNALNLKSVLSLDLPNDNENGGISLHSYVHNNERSLEHSVETKLLAEDVIRLAKEAGLDDRDISIMLLRSGLEPNFKTEKGFCTMQEVADILNLSKERIRQLEKNAYEKIREKVHF